MARMRETIHPGWLRGEWTIQKGRTRVSAANTITPFGYWNRWAVLQVGVNNWAGMLATAPSGELGRFVSLLNNIPGAQETGIYFYDGTNWHCDINAWGLLYLSTSSTPCVGSILPDGELAGLFGVQQAGNGVSLNSWASLNTGSVTPSPVLAPGMPGPNSAWGAWSHNADAVIVTWVLKSPAQSVTFGSLGWTGATFAVNGTSPPTTFTTLGYYNSASLWAGSSNPAPLAGLSVSTQSVLENPITVAPGEVLTVSYRVALAV